MDAQFDLFGDSAVAEEPAAPIVAAPPAWPAAEANPEPRATEALAARGEPDTWARESQRLYLTNMARRLPIHKAQGETHRAAVIVHNAPYILMKLNGMAGVW
ncbi:hypothetical protein [Burkholderia gladioli]|uniref:hypothetical protein n=1 Tax=Burkholderia gladioli TaxID=28095 RepID=UPI001640031D|nr:hypothetical protein [Burkholderia gladioli]